MDSKQVTNQAADISNPQTGLRAVSSLRALADRLELAQVEEALRQGMSWQQIADALGVSRQAVHKKYAKKIDPSIKVPRRSV
ncbi:MAG: helix-turn-helix domain-containing protein [Rothia sp. (in: high G+C Gram-positive bacteria)]|nr:helix-turn-helix domain-containing protein [Rothia sp. (in: high G+C Gram-positive bacteria)]